MERVQTVLNKTWNGLRTYVSYWVETGRELREIYPEYGTKTIVGVGTCSGFFEGVLYNIPLVIASGVLQATNHDGISPYVGLIPGLAFPLLRGAQAYLGTLRKREITNCNQLETL